MFKELDINSEILLEQVIKKVNNGGGTINFAIIDPIYLENKDVNYKKIANDLRDKGYFDKVEFLGLHNIKAYISKKGLNYFNEKKEAPNEIEYQTFQVLKELRNKFEIGMYKISYDKLKIFEIKKDKFLNIVEYLIDNGFIKGNIYLGGDVGIDSITVMGERAIRNPDLLFNIERNIKDEGIKIEGSVGSFINQSSIYSSKLKVNQNINQEIKKNMFSRFLKWLMDFWVQLLIGVLTGIISTLIVQYFFGII